MRGLFMINLKVALAPLEVKFGQEHIYIIRSSTSLILPFFFLSFILSLHPNLHLYPHPPATPCNTPRQPNTSSSLILPFSHPHLHSHLHLPTTPCTTPSQPNRPSPHHPPVHQHLPHHSLLLSLCSSLTAPLPAPTPTPAAIPCTTPS